MHAWPQNMAEMIANTNTYRCVFGNDAEYDHSLQFHFHKCTC